MSPGPAVAGCGYTVHGESRRRAATAAGAPYRPGCQRSVNGSVKAPGPGDAAPTPARGARR